MPRRSKPIEVRLTLVPAPPDFEKRVERAFSAYVHLLAKAALRTRCTRCGMCDSRRLGRTGGKDVVCDNCRGKTLAGGAACGDPRAANWGV